MSAGEWRSGAGGGGGMVGVRGAGEGEAREWGSER